MGCLNSSPAMPPDPPRVECLVCFSEADMVLYPCGHHCICHDCATTLSNNDHERIGDGKYMKIKLRRGHALFCPLCRRITIPIKLYQNNTYHTL